MVSEKLDRRVNRTRRRIRKSLFLLMKKLPYERIRTAHIAEEADISRSTFYLHYETKDDLLDSVIDEIIGEYMAALDAPEQNRKMEPTYLLFSLWKENMSEMQLIVRAGLEHRIFQRLRKSNIKHEHIDNIHNHLLNDYVHELVNGAEFGLLLRWTRDGGKIPIDQMVGLYNELQIDDLFATIEQKMPEFGA